MPATVPTAGLVGRDGELAHVEYHLAAIREGNGSALSFTGEPGCGKTALLGAACERADGMWTLSCRGVEWEAELPFSGLHEVLRPLLALREALPDPQRDAVEAALGLRPADAPHTLHLCAGALSLLTEATRERPALVVVDDLQWVDSATAQVLAFIARRLSGERLGLLVASRPGTVLPGVAPPTVLKPLDVHDVARLAESRLGHRLPDAAALDLASASGGNPLAVIGSIEQLGSTIWTRGGLLDAPLPVGDLIDQSFAGRLDAMPEAERKAVEFVAASLDDREEILVAALELRGGSRTDLVEAERAKVLELRAGRVEFVHPLLRALVHRRADRERMRGAHAALAQATAQDPGASAWHAACATTGTDDAVASALDAAAEQFLARGGTLSAAQALARAAELTSDPNVRAERLVRAAVGAHRAGRTRWGLTLADEAVAVAADVAGGLRAEFTVAELGTQIDAGLSERYFAIADRAEGVDDDLAVRALTSLAIRLTLEGNAALLQEIATRLEFFKRQHTSLTPASRSDLDATLGTLQVLTDFSGDVGEGVKLLVSGAERRVGFADDVHLVEPLVWVDAFEVAQRLVDATASAARDQGDALALIGGLWAEGYLFAMTGRWRAANAALDEAMRLSESVDHRGAPIWIGYTKALVRAGQGDPSLAGDLGGIAAAAAAIGIGVAEEFVGAAEGLIALGRADGPGAVAALERARRWTREAGHVEPSAGPWAADLVDAFLLAGDMACAQQAIEELRTYASRTGRAWAVASLARFDGRLREDEAYDASFTTAFAAFDQAREPFRKGWARLDYGRRLRRSRRDDESRVQFHAALIQFEELDAAPWIAITRRELGLGGHTPGGEVDPDALTAQESQVAQLVAGGASNKEAAANLFLSPKTIEAHLSRIYRKLGVTSRTQLAVRLRDGPSPAAGPRL